MMTKERVFITYKHIIFVNQTFFKATEKIFLTKELDCFQLLLGRTWVIKMGKPNLNVHKICILKVANWALNMVLFWCIGVDFGLTLTKIAPSKVAVSHNFKKLWSQICAPNIMQICPQQHHKSVISLSLKKFGANKVQ